MVVKKIYCQNSSECNWEGCRGTRGGGFGFGIGSPTRWRRELVLQGNLAVKFPRRLASGWPPLLGQRAVVHGAPRAPGARQTPEIEWGVLPFSTFPQTLPEAAKGPPAKAMAPGTSEVWRKNSPAPLKSSHGASRIPRFFGGGHWQYAEPSHLGDWSSAATSCVLGDGPEATMKTDFKFSNLLGTVYCQGNLLFSPDGTHLFSPVGNRVTVFNLVEYA